MLKLIHSEVLNMWNCGFLLQNFNTDTMNRCFEAGTVSCAKNHIYPKPNKDKYNILEDNKFSTDMLFRPQRVQLKLHVGECATWWLGTVISLAIIGEGRHVCASCSYILHIVLSFCN